jgi:ABC-type branched-subunit amino acid transport system ATPase component
MLKLEAVSKKFGGLQAVSDCSFEIKKGTITALIGPNGAGKTTIFNLILGVIKPDSGKIYFNDLLINNLPIFKRVRLGISRTFQSVRLFKNLTVGDNLSLVSGDKEAIRKTISFLGLETDLDFPVSGLSFGQQKILALARALLLPHQLLMLDEPVAGVNPLLREKFKRIFQELRDKGETIFLIEHDMNFVMNLADYVIVMAGGKVLAKGSASEVQKDPQVLESYLGEQI